MFLKREQEEFIKKDFTLTRDAPLQNMKVYNILVTHQYKAHDTFITRDTPIQNNTSL